MADDESGGRAADHHRRQDRNGGNRQADENGIYDRQHAWFTCYAPYDDPEIAITVIVEDGGEGSAYAVPVADRVLRAYFELAGPAQAGSGAARMRRSDAIDLPVLADSAAFPEPGQLRSDRRRLVPD